MQLKKNIKLIIVAIILFTIFLSGIAIYIASSLAIYSTPEEGLMAIKNTTSENILKVEDNDRISIILFLDDTGWYETYYFFHTDSGWINIPKGRVVLQKSANNDELGILSIVLVSEIKNHYIIAVSHMSNQVSYPIIKDSLNTKFKVIRDGRNNDLAESTYCYSSFALLTTLPSDYELYVNGETIKVN